MSSKPIFLNYVLAGYPLLWVETYEEFRAITTFAKEMSQAKEEYNLYSWDRVDGVKIRRIENDVLKSAKVEVEGLDDPLVVLDWAASKEMSDDSILFLQDYHHYAKKDSVSRKIRNLIPSFKAKGKVLVIISHTVDIPDEIEKEITVIPFRLPDIKELKNTLKSVCESANAPYPKTGKDLPILQAALGMTSFEAENAFSVSLIENKAFDVGTVNREKAAIVKKTGLLEVVEVKETINDVGGLNNLKAWLTAREDCFSEKAQEFGIAPPKGLLLVGIPGTGKSLSAKCVANLWKRPLLRLDMGKVFGSYVGESESNIRKCLDIAEAVAPCCLWIDELEKSFSGTKGSGSDTHEVSKRVYSTFLTWLQEKTSDVFIVATANDVESLDPALLRGGRLDTIFWVDLPDSKQREEIITIHLAKVGRKPKNFDIKKLAKASEKFTGAEIEVWLKEALVYAFQHGHELCDQDLLDVKGEVTPIATLMAEDIKRSRRWAEERKVKLASIGTEELEPKVARKISLGDIPAVAS